MKNYLLFPALTIIFLIINSSLHAQEGTWVEQTLPYDSGWVQGIVYVDSVTAWAIGKNKRSDKAIIMSTSDMGSTWDIQDESLNGTLKSLFMANLQTGYAVGRNDDNGQISILKTDDGETWFNQAVPAIKGDLLDVSFTTPLKGCAVGVNTEGNPDKFAIIYTSDGETWQEANFPDVDDGSLWALSFPTENDGWCVGNNWLFKTTNFILRTSDGGQNWDLVNHPITNAKISGVDFWTTDSGLVYGTAADTAFVMNTYDGGQNWFMMGLPIETISSSSVKSVSIKEKSCKKTVISFAIYASGIDETTNKFTQYGYMVVRYSDCGESDGEKHIYFTLTYNTVGQPPIYNEYQSQLIPQNNETRTIATVPQTESGGNEGQSIYSATVGGINAVNESPIMFLNTPNYTINSTSPPDITIHTNQVTINISDKGEIIINNEPTGMYNDSYHLTINGGIQQNLNVDLSGITDKNRGTIIDCTINTGIGGGEHTLTGSESINIDNTFVNNSGKTTANGGDGNDMVFVESGSVSFNGGGGNDKYVDQTKEDLENGTEKSAQTDTVYCIYNDNLGKDSIDYSNYGWPVNLGLDLQGLPQQISPGRYLEINGQIENFSGSTFDDKITVKLLVDETRYVDGGANELGDTLIVDALEKHLTDDGTTISAEGFQPINYVNIEHVIITNIATNVKETNLSKYVLGLEVYPNPFSNSIMIKSSEEVEISIVNINGLVIKNIQLNKNELIKWVPKGTLMPGIYFIRATSNTKMEVKKALFLGK
ncbi:MAG: T9SS type A sorting domain-containing protein [Prolixibacteraceae bacterium]|nr:T9SS type A sorting domain-containing protein [Prolixibacteraceae bacterium]